MHALVSYFPAKWLMRSGEFTHDMLPISPTQGRADAAAPKHQAGPGCSVIVIIVIDILRLCEGLHLSSSRSEAECPRIFWDRHGDAVEPRTV